MHKRTIILGAGAAGLFCAAHTGGDTLVLDHAKKAGEKIRISGGGRCNFTNMEIEAKNYLSENPHFMKSALARYSQWDFIELVSRHGIAWHEKTLGQLFCDESAKDIIAMLLKEIDAAGAEVWLETAIESVSLSDSGWSVVVSRNGAQKRLTCDHLVVATGGKSIPKMGATGFAYKLAEEFGHDLTDTRPALVPFTFSDARFAPISGTATPVTLRAERGPTFAEALLFTHRGLSGPSALQVSSYWLDGEEITADLCPGVDIAAHFAKARKDSPRKNATTILGQILPTRLVDQCAEEWEVTGNVAEWSDSRIDQLSQRLHSWSVKPTGTEGYRTAEVTLGGISTNGLSSKTMMSKHAPNLYFIGECVDVTGWLGGYNFQWAWSSAFAAGEAIRGAI